MKNKRNDFSSLLLCPQVKHSFDWKHAKPLVGYLDRLQRPCYGVARVRTSGRTGSSFLCSESVFKEYFELIQKDQILTRVHHAASALLEVFSLYIDVSDWKQQRLKKLRSDVDYLIESLILAAQSDTMEKKLKVDFAGILAKSMKKKGSFTPYFFRGTLWRTVRNRAVFAAHGCVQAMAFMRSIYESKGYWYELPAALELSAINDHITRFSSKESVIGEVELDAIKLAVDIVVPPGTKYCPKSVCPTFSAGFEAPLKTGGNHGKVSIDEQLVLESLGPVFGCTDHLSRKQTLHCVTAAFNEKNRMAYYLIKEAGKFRSITAGPANAYTALRGLQGQLLKLWASKPFSTMTSEVIERLMNRIYDDEFGNIHEDEENLYVSGDYDAATDYLKLGATMCALERILRNLDVPWDIAIVALSSFMKGEVHYKRTVLGEDRVIQHTNGQPMGHPLSFPLLCIINLASYLMARGFNGSMSVDRVRSEIYQSKIMINGDDILFRGNEGLKTRWIYHAGQLGLVVNEIKSYDSCDQGLINSICVIKTGKKRKPVVVDYYNQGLAKCHKLKAEPLRLIQTAQAIWDKLGAGNLSKKVVKRGRMHFLKTLSPRIKPVKIGELEFVPNFFLPKSLGGLGLESDDRHFYISFAQRKVAAFLSENPQFQWLNERAKINGSPFAIKQALKAFGRMKPALERRRLIGPLTKERDPEAISDQYFSLCLDRFKYLKTPKFEEPTEIITRFLVKEALNSKIPAMNETKLRSHKGLFSFQIVGEQYKFQYSPPIPSYVHATYDYDSEEEFD